MDSPLTNPDTLEIANMREAITGYAIRAGQVILIYDFLKVVKILMKLHKVTLNDAIEMAEKIEEAWFGPGTPIVFHGATHEEIQDIFNVGKPSTIN